VTFEATVFDATCAQTAPASSSSIPTYRSNSIDFDVRQRSAVQHENNETSFTRNYD
jgi:hypothetical protein